MKASFLLMCVKISTHFSCGSRYYGFIVHLPPFDKSQVVVPVPGLFGVAVMVSAEVAGVEIDAQAPTIAAAGADTPSENSTKVLFAYDFASIIHERFADLIV